MSPEHFEHFEHPNPLLVFRRFLPNIAAGRPSSFEAANKDFL